MSIDRRTATINGEKIAYTYNIKTREVLVPAKGIQFIATCYDWAKAEITDALAAQATVTETPAAEVAEVVAEPRKRTVLIGKNDGLVHASRNYTTKCTGKSRDFHIEYTAAALTCPACIAAEGQAAVQREAKAAAAATGTQLPNLFDTGTLHHELVYLADGTPAPKCRNRVTNGQAVFRANGTVSCNSCSGAHRPGTHLG